MDKALDLSILSSSSSSFTLATKTSRSMSGSEDPLSSSTEKEKGKGELALDETGLAPSGTNAAPTVEDDTHDQDQGNEQPVFEELLDDEAVSRAGSGDEIHTPLLTVYTYRSKSF